MSDFSFLEIVTVIGFVMVSFIGYLVLKTQERIIVQNRNIVSVLRDIRDGNKPHTFDED